jgi:hypothetical protein
MPNSTLLKVLLILLALIPIAVWAYVTYGFAISYQMAEAGSRKTGYAAAILMILMLALAPAFIGGILMIVGAALLGRRPLGGRIAASIGLGILIVTAIVAFGFEAATADYSMYIAAIAYVLAHAGLLAWLWRRGPNARRRFEAL